MVNLFSGLPDQLVKRASSLKSLGMENGYAWSLEDARKVMLYIHERHPELLILGGDILKPVNSDRGFEYIYANWSFEPMGSSKDAINSILQANKYFDRIEELNPSVELFVDLVVDKSL